MNREIQVGHTAPQQWMSLAELVMDVEPGDDPGEPLARLVHGRQLRHHLDQCLHAFVAALECGLGHRVLERAGGDRVALLLIRVQ